MVSRVEVKEGSAVQSFKHIWVLQIHTYIVTSSSAQHMDSGCMRANVTIQANWDIRLVDMPHIIRAAHSHSAPAAVVVPVQAIWSGKLVGIPHIIRSHQTQGLAAHPKLFV